MSKHTAFEDGQPKSYWIDSTPTTDYPTLEEDIKVDVAIIGGGLTGITTAMLLKKEGFKIAVLEADRIVMGTTGHTTAKITSQHGLIYNTMITDFGFEKAKQYADANETAKDFILKTIEEYDIDCDLVRLPAYIYTEDDSYKKQIEQEVKAATKLGLKAEYHDSVDLPLNIKGAMSFADQAQFHPRKYLLALAKEIHGDDCRIYENTTVVNITEGEPVVVTTREGKKVTAAKVVIASHFPCHDGLGFYFTRLRPERSYVLGVKIKEDFPEGMYINAEMPARSLRAQRYKGDKIILIGGDHHKTAHGEDMDVHYNNLKKFTEKNYTVEDYLYKWSTQDYTTLDNIPYIGYLTAGKPNLFVGTGYGKWGMTTSTVAAMLIRDLMVKHESSWQDVYNPSRFNLTSLKNFVIENADMANQLVDGKLRGGADHEKVPKGEARILNLDGDKYGAYRDEDGYVHIVDVTCTHAGCELRWNAADKTWDCPCHGSRFSIDGDNVEGPAFRKLQHRGGHSNNVDPDIF